MNTATSRRNTLPEANEQHTCDECDTTCGSLTQLADHKQEHEMEQDTEPLEVEECDTYEEEEAQTVFYKLIKVLKFLSTSHPVPFCILYSVHEDINLVKQGLGLLEELEFVTLDMEAQIAKPNSNKILKFLFPDPMKKTEKINILRDLLKTLSDSLSSTSSISFEKVLPHALRAWNIARTCDSLLLEFIHTLPMNITNKMEKLDDSQLYLEVAKQALADISRIQGYNPDEYRTFCLKFHVANALRRLMRYREAWKILRTLLPAVKRCLPFEHWLTIDIMKDCVYILQIRKDFDWAYKEQTEVCKFFERRYGGTEETAKQFYIKAQLLFKLGEFIEADEVFRQVLDWKLKNGRENNSQEISTWIQKCEIGMRANEAKVIAEDLLMKNPYKPEMRKIMRAVETLRRATMDRNSSSPSPW